ncbi:MAG: hypothetical protein KY432_05295, partial [Acidobacteria bacterium]|nr:hypothetical protein [Acidobacteriota bacterium]
RTPRLKIYQDQAGPRPDHLGQLVRRLDRPGHRRCAPDPCGEQQIRDEGYDLYVVLDATIGLGKTDDEEAPRDEMKQQLALPAPDAQFRINVNDLGFLRSVGIDPTRKVKSRN